MGTMKSKQTSKTIKSIEEKRDRSSLKRLSLKSLKQEYKVEPSRGFIVRFAGKAETTNPGGENIDECLQDLYKKVRHTLNSLPKVCLEISSQEIKIRWIHDTGSEDQEEFVVPFSRISFVVADKKHQLFAFIDFVSQKPRKAECYAFICNESEKSEAIANALSDAFKVVYERTGSRSTSFVQESDAK